MGPIRRAFHISMLDRVVMDVVAVSLQVVFVFDRVFPKTALPNAATPTRFTRSRDRKLFSPQIQPCRSEIRFDPLPARRVIAVPRWKSPNSVQMIVKQYGSECLKRKCRSHLTHGRSQEFSRRLMAKCWISSQRDDCEKISAAGYKPSAVIRHSAALEMLAVIKVHFACAHAPYGIAASFFTSPFGINTNRTFVPFSGMFSVKASNCRFVLSWLLLTGRSSVAVLKFETQIKSPASA